MDPRSPAAILDREFLDVRCMLIETAATLDRLDLAIAEHGADGIDAVRRDRLARLRQAMSLLAAPEPPAAADPRCGPAARAEALLRLFSDD